MSHRPQRIVFAGTPEFAAECLKKLLENEYSIVGTYTQPDRPAGRGRKLAPPPVKVLATANNIPVFQPLSLKSEEAQDELAALKPDLLIVVAYGLILPKIVLDIPTYGCINVHASLLPRWRGAAPIQRAIQAGDTETGVTIMQMDVGLDTGDMLLKKNLTLSPTETGSTLHDRLAIIGAEALVENLPDIFNESLKPETQDNDLANYAEKLSKHEAAINWDESAEIIERKIRAFNSWPVAHTLLGKDRVRIWQACATNTCSNDSPGTIVNTENDALNVATGKGLLAITRLQLPGGKQVSVKDLLNSRRDQFKPCTQFDNEQLVSK